MDVLKQLKEAQQRVLARLHELEPLAREYETLKNEAEKLGLDVGQKPQRSAERPASTKGAATARRSARPSSSSTRRRRSARGSRREQVLRTAEAKGPMRVSDIGKELGVDPTGLYRVVNQLVSEGELSKDGPLISAVTATK